MTLGQRLRSVRTAKGYSLSRLAKELGYPEVSGYASLPIVWETGYLPPKRRTNRRSRCGIDLKTLFRLASVYGLTLSELFEGVTEL